VNTAEVATPLAFVVAVFTPPAKVPLAPVAGAVNVTTTPLVGDPPVVTVATSGAANAALTAALCGVPLVAVIETTGGVELELPQPARKNNGKRDKARMPAYALRFIANPQIVPSSLWHAHVIAATRGFRARSASYRPGLPLSRSGPGRLACP
jgi:hypothetical protein